MIRVKPNHSNTQHFQHTVKPLKSGPLGGHLLYGIAEVTGFRAADSGECFCDCLKGKKKQRKPPSEGAGQSTARMYLPYLLLAVFTLVGFKVEFTFL